MKKKEYFGFLVHPRDLEDFYIKYPIFRILPQRLTEFATRNMPPVVVSKVKGLRNASGEPVEGYVIAITTTARQMMEDRGHALKKIRDAVKFSKKLGVKILGLGALTSSLSKGGLDAAGYGVAINTGRAFTVKNIGDYVDWAERKTGFNKKEIVVGIVGAAGSIGSSVATLLEDKGFTRFRLVDLEDKLHQVQDFLSAKAEDLEIKIGHKIELIRDADLIIAATNAPEVVIEPDDLKIGAIIINDAQPSDISPRVVIERPDVLVIEGGVVKIEDLNTGFNFRLKNKNDTFSCMAESMILAANHHFDDFGLGKLDMSLVSQIETMSKQLPGISISPQNSHLQIEEINYEEIRGLIRKEAFAAWTR